MVCVWFYVFFLGRQPSSPTVVHFPEQAGILIAHLRKKAVHTKCQPCIWNKGLMEVLREISGHDRGLTLPVGKGLYDVLTANQGKRVLMVFTRSLVILFQMCFCCPVDWGDLWPWGLHPALPRDVARGSWSHCKKEFKERPDTRVERCKLESLLKWEYTLDRETNHKRLLTLGIKLRVARR